MPGPDWHAACWLHLAQTSATQVEAAVDWQGMFAIKMLVAEIVVRASAVYWVLFLISLIGRDARWVRCTSEPPATGVA
jgi:hypothetical protein